MDTDGLPDSELANAGENAAAVRLDGRVVGGWAVDGDEALITIIAAIIAVAVVAALTALIAFLGGWSYCYLTGKQCTITDMLLHGLAIVSLTLVIGLVLRATLECVIESTIMVG